MRKPGNRTVLIVVGLALAASVAIGGVLGQLSGDDGNNLEETRPALSAPTVTQGATAAAGTPRTTPSGTSTALAAIPVASPAEATPATPASPAATPATPEATPER